MSPRSLLGVHAPRLRSERARGPDGASLELALGREQGFMANSSVNRQEESPAGRPSGEKISQYLGRWTKDEDTMRLLVLLCTRHAADRSHLSVKPEEHRYPYPGSPLLFSFFPRTHAQRCPVGPTSASDVASRRWIFCANIASYSSSTIIC